MEEQVAAFEERVREIFRNNESDDSLLEEILKAILILFLLGGNLETEEDLSRVDKEFLDNLYQLSLSSARGIIERNQSGTDMEPTVVKLSRHVSGAYSYSLMAHGMEDDKLYEWELGEADHCGDCVGYSGLGPRPGGFWRRVATDRGHFPQSPYLECKGLHCPCRMVEADGT